MSDGAGRLRMGLLLDDALIPWWIAPGLQVIRDRGMAEVVLAVIRGSEPPSPKPSRPVSWWRHRALLGFALVERLDRKRAGPRRPGEVDRALTDLCPGADVVTVQPALTRFSDTILPEDVDLIQGYRLDLLLRIGFRILRGPVLSAARQGVWSFHHGDNRLYRGGPAGVWEVLQDRPESGITLQRLTEALDGGEVLAWSVLATRRFSFEENLRHLLRHSSRMLVQAVARVVAGRPAAHSDLPAASHWSPYAHRLYRKPRNVELARGILGLAGRHARGRLRNAGRKLQWSIAWHWDGTGTSDAPHPVFHQYREIPTPRDRYWADPFVVAEGDKWWMFFEEFQYRAGRGEILVREMGPGGPVGPPRPALQRPYHLSYPQVFPYQGRWYMLPETGAARRLEYYVADEFPFRWTLHASLMEGTRIADATLLQHQDHWYLFGSIGPEGFEASDELSAFVADSPFGPFTPHPGNPLVSDIRRARMAGRFFRSGALLYRPAQRCVPLYGAGIVVHQVLELTPSVYRERIADEIAPAWSGKENMVGMHTLNCDAGLSAIDCLRLVRR